MTPLFALVFLFLETGHPADFKIGNVGVFGSKAACESAQSYLQGYYAGQGPEYSNSVTWCAPVSAIGVYAPQSTQPAPSANDKAM